jgi:hypothetical protein
MIALHLSQMIKTQQKPDKKIFKKNSKRFELGGNIGGVEIELDLHKLGTYES